MGRALEKSHLRVIGLDDGPFRRGQRRAPLVAVALSVPGGIEGIERSTVAVDGTDATDVAIRMLRRSPYLAGCRAILVDGATVGGFNVLDLGALARATDRPVVSVTRRAPDLPAIRAALSAYLPDAARRFAVLRRQRPFRVGAPEGARWIAVAGASRAEANRLLVRTTLVGNLPEPLRVARLVARAIAARSRRVPLRGAAGRGAPAAPAARRARGG